MQRDIFLQMCQKVSVLKSGLFGIKENVPDELIAIYNGVKYYPVSYELSFDKGQTVHKAILHDLKTNSIICADLNSVDKL